MAINLGRIGKFSIKIEINVQKVSENFKILKITKFSTTFLSFVNFFFFSKIYKFYSRKLANC
jgi:hypothetical protein